jgi:hypothetical protein
VGRVSGSHNANEHAPEKAQAFSMHVCRNDEAISTQAGHIKPGSRGASLYRTKGGSDIISGSIIRHRKLSRRSMVPI